MSAWRPRTDEEEKAFQELRRLNKLSNPSPYRPYQPPDQAPSQLPDQTPSQPPYQPNARDCRTILIGIVTIPAAAYATIGFFYPYGLPFTGIAWWVCMGGAFLMWLNTRKT